MSETEFTKGEWEVKSTSIHPARIKVKGKKGMQGRIIGDARSIDDASLIACAPEMYEMLNNICDLANGDMGGLVDNMLMYFDDIEKLLSKARGENQ